jgi:hypothetical protein
MIRLIQHMQQHMRYCGVVSKTLLSHIKYGSVDPYRWHDNNFCGMKKRSISTLSVEIYHKHAEESLQQLQTWLEQLVDTATIGDADVEYAMGVLTLRLGSHGTYVFNKQPPNQQLWLSSPIR